MTLDAARELDREDPLASYRERFHRPADTVYLCGHSLGLQPKSAAEKVEQELEDWKTMGVRGHLGARRPWMPYHELLAEQGARVVGARPAEVVHMNTLTVNAHLLMVSFYRPTPERHKILIEEHAFPSDHYAVVSQIRFHGFDPAESLVVVGLDDDIHEAIDRAGDALALVWLGGVNYYSGQVFDMRSITEHGHKVGATVGFDLAHGAGNVPLELHDWNVDCAAWCTYKYLNGGPGSVAAAFVHERHATRDDLPRFAGWWGHDKSTRFEMGPEFNAIPGAEGWQLSNPPILSLAPVLASLEMFDEVGMDALRAKSEKLTRYFDELIDNELGGRVDIVTPRESARRGAQVSLRILTGKGRAVYDAISARGVVCDWREPDVIRAAAAPLYNGFEDVYRFVDILKDTVLP